jgi:hypothetical protein
LTVTSGQVGKDLECPCGVAFTFDRTMLASAGNHRLLTVLGVAGAVLLLGGVGAYFVFMPGKPKEKTVAVEPPVPPAPNLSVPPKTETKPEVKPAPATPVSAPKPEPKPAAPAAASGLTGLAKVHRLASLAAVDGFSAPVGEGWIPAGSDGAPSKIEKKAGRQAVFLEDKWVAGEASRKQGFTVAVQIKMVANGRSDNGFAVWLDDNAPGCHGGMLRICPDQVAWGKDAKSAKVLLKADNTDVMHEYRVAALSPSGYAVWRDGVKIGDKLWGDLDVRKNAAIFGMFTSHETCSAIVGGLAVDSSGVKAP